MQTRHSRGLPGGSKISTERRSTPTKGMELSELHETHSSWFLTGLSSHGRLSLCTSSLESPGEVYFHSQSISAFLWRENRPCYHCDRLRGNGTRTVSGKRYSRTAVEGRCCRLRAGFSDVLLDIRPSLHVEICFLHDRGTIVGVRHIMEYGTHVVAGSEHLRSFETLSQVVEEPLRLSRSLSFDLLGKPCR